MTTSDIWQSSTLNSNKNYQSLSFPSSYNINNSNQFHTTDNNHFDYQPSPYLIDPYSHVFPSNYSIDPYSNQAVYNPASMESSTYIAPTDTYQHFRPIYDDPTPAPSSIDTQLDYQSISSQWDLGTMKMPSHNGMYMNSKCSTSRNRCQPVFFFFSLTYTKQKMREKMSVF